MKLNKTPCYIIGLNPPTKKLKYLKTFGLNPVWVKGVDGKKVKINDSKNYISQKYLDFLTPGTVGCAMSHMKIWESIIENNLDYAIVFEDDIVLTKNFNKIYEQAMLNVPSNFDILYLGANGANSSDINFQSVVNFFMLLGKQQPEFKKINKYINSPSVTAGTHAYVVSNKGAKKLINLLKGTLNFHIDVCIQTLYCEKKLNNYIVNPRIAFQTSTDSMLSENILSQHPFLINKLLANILVDKKIRLNYGISADIYKLGIFHINLMSILFLALGTILMFLYTKNKSISIKHISVIFILVSLFDIYHIIQSFSPQLIKIIFHYLLLLSPILFFKIVTKLHNLRVCN